MNEQELMISDTMEAELDRDWNEDGEGDMEWAQDEADQLMQAREDTTAPDNGGDAAAADQRQEGEADRQTPYMIPYTFMGETKQMDAAEAPRYIQMGMHYPTVRAERDRLRAQAQENAAAVELVKEYAQEKGMDMPRYLEWARSQNPAGEQKADWPEPKEADPGIRAIRARQEEIRKQVYAQREARQRDIGEFMRAHPGVDPGGIPQEVWQQVRQGATLTGAYAMHENAQLRAQLAAERQNRLNQQRSPGGLSANSGLEMDEIDRNWADDD